MLKIAAGLLLGAFALCLPLAAPAEPKPAPPPERISITLQTLRISARTSPVTFSSAHPASEVYNTLLQVPGTEATEIRVVTPTDFSGSAQYSRFLTFMAQDHGKPSLSLISAPTTLEATPHINSDGTITVRLSMEVTSFVPSAAPIAAGAVPNTTSQSITTTRTFASGRTILLDGIPQITPDGRTKVASPSEGLLQFVTVTILPSEKTAAR